MIKGPLKITVTGPTGSGKTQLLHILETILKTFGYNLIMSEDAHTIEVIKND